jgi:hypothetical protein
MDAAENLALCFNTVADDFAATLWALGREHVNRALK